MPDHVHWLLKLQSSNVSLSKTLSYVKTRSAGFAFKKFGIKGLWQKGFHDHAVRKEEDLIKIARYIVANPVRAGLVKSVRDYSHWDVVWI
jgi:REP element-mobilizing transposase RayT